MVSSWWSAACLALLFVLVPALGLFQQEWFFDVAYSRNNAYEVLDEELVWSVTRNFQAFLLGIEGLRIFDEDQAAHLHEVKQVYWFLRNICVVLIVLVLLGLALRPAPSQLLWQAGVAGFGLLGVLILLSLNWEWFFTTFHEVFFHGPYQFSSASLMLRLWGGNFFVVAALVAGVQTLALSMFSLLLGKFCDRVQKPIWPRSGCL